MKTNLVNQKIPIFFAMYMFIFLPEDWAPAPTLHQNLFVTAPNPNSNLRPSPTYPKAPNRCYKTFLTPVKKDNIEVERVCFNKEGSTLQLTTVDGRRAFVVVPNNPNLVDILTKVYSSHETYTLLFPYLNNFVSI